MAEYPDFIRKLPEADTQLRGFWAWLLQGKTASGTFFQAREDSTVPETVTPRSGDRRGGELLLPIGGRTPA